MPAAALIPAPDAVPGGVASSVVPCAAHSSYDCPGAAVAAAVMRVAERAWARNVVTDGVDPTGAPAGAIPGTVMSSHSTSEA
jgi:hypothetical protein